MEKISLDELRSKNLSELKEVEAELTLKIAKMKMDLAMNKLKKNNQLLQGKKDLARILTIKREKERNISYQPRDLSSTKRKLVTQ